MYDANKRHPSTQHMLKMLTPNPNLPEGLPKALGQWAYEQAVSILEELPEDSPEITAGLRKLLEAKDCFVRAAVLGPTVDYRDR